MNPENPSKQTGSFDDMQRQRRLDALTEGGGEPYYWARLLVDGECPCNKNTPPALGVVDQFGFDRQNPQRTGAATMSPEEWAEYVRAANEGAVLARTALHPSNPNSGLERALARVREERRKKR